MKNRTQFKTQGKSSPTNAAEFEALLRSGMDDLMVKTSIHQDAWGLGREDQWMLDHGSAELVFTFPDLVVSAPAQIIGSWEQAGGIWTWAWADPAIPELLQVDSYRVRDYGMQHGFQHLVTASWEAEETHCWYMTALAGWLFEARGAYRGISDGTCTFMTFRDVAQNPIPPAMQEGAPHGFMTLAAEDFRNCRSNSDEQREACCRYLRGGSLQGIGQSELIHRLGLSSPSVLDLAGYSPDGAQNVMDLLKTISDEEIQRCDSPANACPVTPESQ